MSKLPRPVHSPVHSPVQIMAGGTGGHVFPALAVAARLRELAVPVRWMGTTQGLEADLVPAAGIPFDVLRVHGLRGKGLRRLLTAPAMMSQALMQALGILRRTRPAAVLGMGGFAAGPGGAAAFLLRRPLLVHEQNAIAGLTNRWLAPLATEVLQGFAGALPRGVTVGNPVRAQIAALPPPAARMAGREGPLRILVLGGSLGARALNEVVPAALARLPAALCPTVRHQAGRGQAEAAVRHYADAGIAAEVSPFIDDMAAAYAWADLAVCRAGALTVAELSAAGLGAVLVPYPHAVDDHQTHNARLLTGANAARLIAPVEFTPQRLADELAPLLAERGTLFAMANAARTVARPDATEQIVRRVLACARNHHGSKAALPPGDAAREPGAAP